MKLGIKSSKYEHKVKGNQYMTLMIITDATKDPKTIRIPKLIRFPLLILLVVVVLGSFLVYERVVGIESDMIEKSLETQVANIASETKDIEIIDLNEELLITKEERYEQLVQLQELANELGLKLEELEDYRDAMAEFKEEIDTNLSNEENDDGAAANEDETKVISKLMISPDFFNKGLSTSGYDADKKSIELTAAYSDAINVDFESEIAKLNNYLKNVISEVDEEEEEFVETSIALEETIPYVEIYPSILPIKETRVSSPFGYRRNPFGGYSSEFHKGIDLQAYYEPIMATGGGTVIEAKYLSGYGYTVIIDHGYGLVTKYAHNKTLYVSVGDIVVRADIISKSGNSGRSTGPHLHYEVLLDGEVQNPLDYIYEEN